MNPHIRNNRRDGSHLVKQLLAWGAGHRRAFPWRDAGSPYGLALAEVLLQKTKAESVEPVWRDLLDHYPDASALMRAEDREVLEIVGKLGLGTQRVSRLKCATRGIAEVGRAQGLGPYGTAVTAFAAGADSSEIPVDGNIARVLTRLNGLRWSRGEPRKKPEIQAAMRRLLESAGHPRRKLELIYALVDLGALVCTPYRPTCGTCPLRPFCAVGSANR